jgi:hypothetical protein
MQAFTMNEAIAPFRSTRKDLLAVPKSDAAILSCCFYAE